MRIAITGSQGFIGHHLKKKLQSLGLTVLALDLQNGEWKVDDAATAKLREAKRQERLARGVPVREWWNTQRRRILDRELDPKIIETYQSSIKMSQPFAQEFRDFWALPEDFSL